MKKCIKIEEKNNYGNKLEVTIQQDGKLEFCIDKPWEGCSETGFGRTLYTHLTKEQAAELRDFLNQALT